MLVIGRSRLMEELLLICREQLMCEHKEIGGL